MTVQLNRSNLAEHLGLSLPTIDKFVKEGMPIVQRGGRGVEWIFDLAEVIQWQIQRAVDAVTSDEITDLDEIERRTAHAKMEMAELELATKRGQVATIRDFERAQAKAFAEIRTNVMNVPQRVVLQLLGETDETGFKAKLRAELVLALQAAAEADLTLPDEDEEDGEDE